MIRSGEVIVCSLSWYDLQENSKKSFSNPLEPSSFTNESNGSLARVLSYFEKKGEDCKSEILEIQQKGSFELLVETLRDEIHHEPATGVLLRAIVGNGTDIEKLKI